ncbi:hypothetical protein BN11_80003 [Nostocoides australiense Ben110]|uniref:Uncharacterized protein n=1 Tax=Nostocoides australiense Ben110 TaxID=1193182 RepID=W6K2Z7_9MICO|nr:hypothetical protein BN11_80003 [Tetrasphaera australiensis Ben110]
MRRYAAQHDVGVGDGRLGATFGVTQRAGIGTRRLGADLQSAFGGDPGDRATAGTDGDDIDHRDLARVGADRALGRQGWFAVEDDRDVRGRATAVARQHLAEAGPLGDERGPEGTSGRTRQDRRNRLVDNLIRREHSAIGLHDIKRNPTGGSAPRVPPGLRRARPREVVKTVVDVLHVARDIGLDRGIDEGGHRALVLAVLAQHLRGDRDDGLGVLLREDGAHRQLVSVLGIRVQEAHADRGDALVLEPPGDLTGALGVERADLVAVEVEAAADGLDEVGRDDARGLDPEVGVAVAVRHRLSGDLEDELVALGGDEPERLDLAFEQFVRRDRGAVADGGDVLAARAHLLQDLRHPVDESVGRIARGAGGLGGHHLAGDLVQGHHVGECAAGVNSYADAPLRRLSHVPDSIDPGARRALSQPDNERRDPRRTSPVEPSRAPASRLLHVDSARHAAMRRV